MNRRFASYYRFALHGLVTTIVAGVLSSFGIAATAQEAIQADSQDPTSGDRIVRYREVYIPTGQMLDKTRGYWPMRSEEFQKRIGSLRNRSVSANGQPARIERAYYHARLAANQLVGGKAKLHFARPADQRQELTLRGLGLAVNNPRWTGRGDKLSPLGRSYRGDVIAMSENSMSLEFEWSLSGTRQPDGTLRILVNLPPSTISRMWLDVPEGQSVHTDHGLVSQVASVDDSLQAFGLRPANPSSPGNIDDSAVEKWSRWQIDLGGKPTAVIDIVSQESQDDKRPIVLYRRESTFFLSERGLELSSDLRLQGHLSRQAILDLGAGLELTVARFGERPLRWMVLPSENAETTRIALELPSDFPGGEQRVELSAIAPLSTGRPWTLPDVRPVGMFWQEAQAKLQVRQSLEVEQLFVRHGRQSRVEPLPSPQNGESIQLQYSDADGSCTVQLATASSRTEATSYTGITIGGGSATANVAYDLVATRGDRFRIEGDIQAPWIIESVRAQPSDALGEWSVEATESGEERLVVRLPEALRPDHDVRLLVQARSPVPEEGKRFGLDRLVPLRLCDVMPASSMVGLRAESPYELTATDDSELTRLDDENLNVRLDSEPGATSWDVVFSVDRGARPARFVLSRSSPHYSANVQIEATWDGQSLVETYTILCQPELSRVGHVIVHFTQASSQPATWLLDQQETLPVSAHRLDDEACQAMNLVSGETWDVRLPQPRREAFSLRAQRRLSATNGQELPLVALPQATSQTGMVTVRSARGAAIALKSTPRLTAVPEIAVTDRRITSARGLYRYEPSLLLLDGDGACTLSLPDDAQRQPAAWAWLCECVSRYGTTGKAIHSVRFMLENTGLDQVTIQMPTESEVHRVMIDGVVAPISTSTEDQRQLTVSLPELVRFPAVTIQFATEHDSLRAVGEVETSLPRIGLPVLSRRCTLQLPSEYSVWSSSQPLLNHSSLASDWGRRLFGPFAGGARRPFDLFRSEDWRHLLQSTAHAQRPNAVQHGESEPATPPSTPWRASTRSRKTDVEPNHRTAWVAQWANDEPVRLRVYRKDVLRLYGWASFLTTVAFCWWWTRREWPARFVLLSLAGTAGAMTQWSSPPWYPLALGMFWGTIVFGLLRLVSPRAGTVQHSSAPSSAKSTAASSTKTFGPPAKSILLALGLVTGLSFSTPAAVLAFAEEEDLSSDSQSIASEYQVFVPVDEQRERTGDYVFIPKPFYDILHRTDDAAEQVEWLIRSAEYRATLAWNAVEASYEVPELMATYEVNVRAADISIRIPLQQRDVLVLPDSIQLDGRPATGGWAEDGRALVVDVDEPGDYQLDVTLRPFNSRTNDVHGFRVTIPELANSRFRLQLPFQMPEVRVEGARGATFLDETDRVLRTELGPIGTLSVNWSSPQAIDDVDTPIDVEQLVWLNVKPGAVVVDAQIQVRVLQGLLRQIVLTTDPRLRWLPVNHPQSVSDVRIRRSDVQTIRMELANPVEDTITLWARFLLTDTSGVGNLRLPRLDVRGARFASRWLAVSIDSSLEYETTGMAEENESVVPEFINAWGPSATIPELAYQLSSGRFDWSLATYLRAPKTTGSQMLSLYIDSDSTTVHFIADLSTDDGHLYQHRLVAPPELEIESLQVSSQGRVGDTDVVKRWARDDKGRVHIFLVRPLSGRHRLVLRGRLRTNLSQEVSLPWLAVQEADIQLTRVSLYRYRDALVDVVSETGLTRLSDESSGENVGAIPREQLFRSVATYDCADDSQLKATIRVSRNQPQVQANVVVHLRREHDTWWSDVECRLSAEGGQLDVLHFDTPRTWGERIQTDPSIRHQWVDLPRSNRRRLVVWPRHSLQGDIVLRMSGSSASPAIEGFRIPEIVPLNIDVKQWIVVLPTVVAQQAIGWDTHQLVQVELPEEVAAPSETRCVAYQILDRNFRAVARPREVSPGTPSILRADNRITYLADDQWFATAAFDLEPAGRSEILCNLPDDCRMVQLRVAGIPATPIRQDDHTWRVGLASDRLPQRIEVVYVGRLVLSPDTTARLPSPRLVDLHPASNAVARVPSDGGEHQSGAGASKDAPGPPQPIRVAEWLWTVCSGQTAPPPWTVVEGQAMDGRQHAQHLYEATSRLVVRVGKRLGEDNPDEFTHWYLPWARVLQRYRQNLDRSLQSAGNDGGSRGELTPWARIDEQLRTLEENLDSQSHPELAALLSAEPSVWDSLPSSRLTTRFIAMQGPDAIAPSVRAVTDASPRMGRLAVGCGLLLIAGVAGWATGKPFWQLWAARWWSLAGIALGLFWWLFLTPSLCGWLIVALSLCGALRNRPVMRRSITV